VTTARLEGRPVAEALLDGCRQRIADGAARGAPAPTLVSVHRGEATPFAVYLRQQGRVATSAGLTFRAEALPPGAGPTELSRRVAALDADPGVHGVLVEHPLPSALDFPAAVARLRPEKDVDGVSATSLGRLVEGDPVHVPAVARAALALAEHHRVRLAGERVAVVGRSPTVGLPLALLLAGRDVNATVTVVHSRTADLAAALAGVTVVFSAAGVPKLLTRSTVPEGATVIDIGLSRLDDPTAPSGGRMVGDADASDLDGWAAALSPVPGGVGPVTVARLMANAVDGWSRLTAPAAAR